jgi:hypothetical protein
VRLAALSAAAADLQAALDAERARAGHAAAALAVRDKEVAQLSEALDESREQTERAVEQVCAANMAAEQAAAAAARDAAQLRDAEARAAGAAELAAEVERLGRKLHNYGALKTKYVQRCSALMEVGGVMGSAGGRAAWRRGCTHHGAAPCCRLAATHDRPPCPCTRFDSRPLIAAAPALSPPNPRPRSASSPRMRKTQSC